MHTQDTLFDDGADRHIIEASTKQSPKSYRVPSLTLIIKSISTIYSLTLMVTTQKIESCWELYLQRQQQSNYLNTLLTSVHVVSDE